MRVKGDFMKKTFSTILASIMLAFVGVICVACCGETSKGEIIAVKANNLPESLHVTETFNFSKVTLEVTYDNDEKETLSKSEVDVDVKNVKEDTEFVLFTDGLSAQTSGNLTVGEYDITAKIIGIEKEYSLGTIVVSDNMNLIYDAAYFILPQSIIDYETNRTITEGSEDSFYNADDMYTVGDDNAFIFKPELRIVAKDSETGISEPAESYNSTAKVYFVNGSEKTLLEDDTYYTRRNFEFDFTEEAIGKVFRIEMLPTDFQYTYNGGEIQPVTFTFKVEDGWNAYTPDDLGRINLIEDGFDPTINKDGEGYARSKSQKIFWNAEDLYHEERYVDIWTEYLTEKGYTDLTAINGIFLHNNISVSDSDLPTKYLISEEEAGSNVSAVNTFRDYAFLYTHYLNEDFIVNGNYFTLDFKGISISRSNTSVDGYVYSEGFSDFEAGHSTVFGFAGKLNNTSTARATVKNLNAQGNTGEVLKKLEDDKNNPKSPEILQVAGSLILTKSMHATTEIENCIAKEFLIAWYGEQGVSKVQENIGNIYINNTKTYDCFNSAVFAYLSDKNQITNSEFKRFGGPAIIMISGKSADNQDEDTLGGFLIDENSVIESYVAGDEPWFHLNDATKFVTPLDILDSELLRAYLKKTMKFEVKDNNGKSEEKWNMIAVSMASGYLNATIPTKTDLTIKESEEQTTIFSTYSTQVTESLGKGYGIIQGSEKGYIELSQNEGGAFAPANPTQIATGLDGTYMQLIMPLSKTAQVSVVYEIQDYQSA